MFCKNCGSTMDPNAAVCIHCGCMKGTGNAFCHNCGSPTVPNAAVCVNCGVLLNPEEKKDNLSVPGQKSKLVAGLLGMFLGAFGAHNFYLGNLKKAIIQVGAGVGGWALLLIMFVWYALLDFDFGVLPAIVVILSSVASAGAEIWGFVEGIMIFTGKINTDSKGNALRD